MNQKSSDNLKIALVTNWFGPDLKGGAEQQAWQIAKRLVAKNVDLTVLTTCSQSFHHCWHTNYYKPGIYELDSLKIKRFSVDKRNPNLFNATVSHMLSLPPSHFLPGQSPISRQKEEIYLSHNINSSELISYLKANKYNYDYFLFLPYLFPLIIKGIEVVGERACLQPCLHDEVYAYLPCVNQAFQQCGQIFFNSQGEANLAEKIIGTWIKDKATIVSEGVEYPSHPSSNTKPLVEGPYILYLGKRCLEKNVDLLIAAFDRFARFNKTNWKLVLAGADTLPLSPLSENILDFGIVSGEQKDNLLAHCKLVANLSANESFSRLIFEAWFYQKPVLVNSNCLATYTALIEANHAGWAAKDLNESYQFFLNLEKIPPEVFCSKGQAGYLYAKKVADWDQVIATYLNCFNKTAQKRQKIVFILPNNDLEHRKILVTYLNLFKNRPIDLTYYSKDQSNHESIASYYADWQLFDYNASFYYWIGENLWPEALRSLQNSSGRKRLLIHDESKIQNEFLNYFDDVYAVNSTTKAKQLPMLSHQSLLDRSLHFDFKTFISQNSDTLNIAFYTEMVTDSQLLILRQIIAECKNHSPYEVRFYIFARNDTTLNIDASYHLNAYVTYPFNWQEIASYLLACDVLLSPSDCFDWDILLKCEQLDIPIIRLGDKKRLANFDFYDQLISLSSDDIQSLCQSIVALQSSDLLRTKACQLTRQINISSSYQNFLSLHIKEFLT